MMKAFNNAATDLRGGWQPSLSLELALAEVLDSPNEPAPIVAAPRQATPKSVADAHQSTSVAQTESTRMPVQTSQASGEETSTQNKDQVTRVEKSEISAGDVIKVWKHLSGSLPKSQANLSALLNSVRMIDMQGKTLILGLASDVLVSKIDKPDQIEAIQKLIKSHFNVDVNVRCVVTTAKGKIPPNVSQDGMVATAIQHGGEIVDMQD